MGHNVFANGREISAKGSDNKSIAAMPDVCLSPPSPPAGPIPIPYPNFSQASDLSNGSRTVKIGNKEIGQKKKSFYKKSNGDEAATKTLGMGVVTHNIQGKTYFAAWSMDVKVEGENVTRQMDLTTHNHMSDPMNSGSMTASVAAVTPPTQETCEELKKENEAARADLAGTSTDKTLVGENGSGKGTTVSSAQARGAGGTTTMSAHSRSKAGERCPGRFEQGGAMEDRKKGKSGLCPEANYTHPAPASQKSGHAEARIFDALGGSPGTVTFNIDWRPKTDPPSKMPCTDCHGMICAAKKCDIQVFLCDKDGKPQEVSDSECPAGPASYRRLQKKMGEPV